jgi:hypothetical protein
MGKTMQRITLAAVSVAAAMTLVACEPAGTTAEPAKTVTVTPTPTETVTATPEPAASPVKTKAAEPTRIRVPNVVGHNHQKAQDEMQAHGLYFLVEKDATGQNRLLLWDRNWVVVRQTPAAGKLVDSATTITLYSKKIGE